ncbi:MAG: hypothetical protein ACON49_07000 [Candidatus Puniceispirillaceae bacterium]
MKNFKGLSMVVIGCMAASYAFAGGLPIDKDEAAKQGESTTSAAVTEISEAPASSETSASSSTDEAAAADQNNQAQASESSGGFIAIEDDPLVVDVSAIMDDDGMGNIQVQWQISDNNASWRNLSGVIQQSFTPREEHVGKRLRVQISYVDGQGNLETIISPASEPVQNVNDRPSGSPLLTGNAREDDALVVDTSLVADEDGIGNFDIIWQRSSTKTDWQAFPEAVGDVLRLTQSHVGYSYRAVMSYVDSHNTREILMTNPSETVENVDDPVEGEVTITGDASEGATLKSQSLGLSDEDGIASLSITWESSKDGRSWRAIESTSQSRSLYLGQSLVGQQVRARASVVDSFGVETIIYSQATNTVKNVNNKPEGKIFVRRVGNS